MPSANGKLKFELIKDTDELPIIKLSGELDETAAEVLFRVKKILRSTPEVKIDTSRITRVNSAGMSHYMKFAQDVSECRIQYVNCSSSFIEFANMLPGILKNASIGSFFGTFYCQPCDEEFYRLIDCPAATRQKTATCPSCGTLIGSVGFLEELQTSGTTPLFLKFIGQSK